MEDKSVVCRIIRLLIFDLDDICKLCFSSYDLHDVADTKVMSEFLHRDGDRYWVTIDGVRQLYRRVECKMCFEVIEKLKKVIIYYFTLLCCIT
jgi:hypothetical protein